MTRAAGCDDYLMIAAMVNVEFCNTASLNQLAMQFFNIGFGTCTILRATFGMGKKLVYFEESMANFRKATLACNMNLETQKRCYRRSRFFLA